MNRLNVRHILCPVDFSRLSYEALATAAAMARERRAELRAFHVVRTAGPAASAGLCSMERQRLAGRLRDMLEGTGVDTNYIGAAVALGDPGTEILRFARALPADVIVMGAARADRPERLSGPVTSVVAARSECPVLTVPRRRVRGANAGVFRRIVCAIDPAPSSARVIEQAVLLAWETGGRVTCVHVHSDNDRLTSAGNLRRGVLAAIPADANRFCEFEVIVEEGVPAVELARIAKAASADLLVIGPPRRWTSTAHAVLRTSQRPVLIAHDLRPLRPGAGNLKPADSIGSPPTPAGRRVG